MELCIQRYRAKRKWDILRQQIFTSYLSLGGVASGQKQFSGGLDEKKMGDMDAEQIAMMAATDYIDLEKVPDGSSSWEVDFVYVVRGFLSYRLPFVLGHRRPKDLELGCQVIRNFLNYVGAPPPQKKKRKKKEKKKSVGMKENEKRTPVLICRHSRRL